MPLLPFVETLFPENISYGSSGGPVFKTDIFTAVSGAEQRNVLWSASRAEYDVAHGIKDKSDMDMILKFFYTMRGRATGFRFKDWSDYTLTNEVIGTGDGAKTVFPLIKTYYTGVGTPYVRDIIKIKTGAIRNVRVNNIAQLVSAYTVNDTSGLITFNSPPGNGLEIKVDCSEFHVPVRFDVDTMPINLEAFEVESWSGIKLVEIRVTR